MADELDDSNDAGERIHKFWRAHSMDTTQVDSTPKIKFFDKIDMWPDPNDHSRLSRMPNAHTLYYSLHEVGCRGRRRRVFHAGRVHARALQCGDLVTARFSS